MGSLTNPGEDFLSAVFSFEKCSDVYIREKLLALIKTADPYVHSLFFPDEPNSDMPKSCVSICREISIRYVSFIISISQQHPDFAAKFKNAGYDGIKNWISCAGVSVGESIYYNYLNGNLELSESILERQNYFDMVAASLTTTSFVKMTEAVTITHSPIPAQLAISALKIFNCSAYIDVAVEWQKTDFFSNTFEGLDLLQLLLNYPWLQEYNVDLLSSELSKNINDTITSSSNKVSSWISSPTGPLSYGLVIFD